LLVTIFLGGITGRNSPRKDKIVIHVGRETYESFYYVKKQAEKLLRERMNNEEFLNLLMEALDRVILSEKRRRVVTSY